MTSHSSPSSWPLPLFLLLFIIILGTVAPDDVEDDHSAPDVSITATDSTLSSSTEPSLAHNDPAVSYSLTKSFRVMCCMGGVPELNHPDLVHNFTLNSASYVSDDPQQGADFADSQNCRLFDGSFVLPKLPPGPLGAHLQLSYVSQVTCKCPELGMGRALDRSCRRLPACANSGIRSLMDPRRCFCLDPFFGDRCEKVCDQGRRVKGSDGRDRCSCAPFYRGEECREPVCMNGGRPVEAAVSAVPLPHQHHHPCECSPRFLGFHCEIPLDVNRTSPINHHHEFSMGTGTGSRFQRFGGDQSHEMFSRDVSGTVFSLVMIVVLVLSMYLLMKHRMQVQSRYLSSRRADLLGACQFPGASGHHHFPPSMPGSARRVELLPVGDHAASASARGAFPSSFARSLAPFLQAATAAAAAADAGPPPYAPPGQRPRRTRNAANEVLPPLPTYEDATKLPALIPATCVTADNAEEEGEAEEQRQTVEEAEEVRTRMEAEDGGREAEEGREANEERGGREEEEVEERERQMR